MGKSAVLIRENPFHWGKWLIFQENQRIERGDTNTIEQYLHYYSLGTAAHSCGNMPVTASFHARALGFAPIELLGFHIMLD